MKLLRHMIGSLSFGILGVAPAIAQSAPQDSVVANQVAQFLNTTTANLKAAGFSAFYIDTLENKNLYASARAIQEKSEDGLVMHKMLEIGRDIENSNPLSEHAEYKATETSLKLIFSEDISNDEGDLVGGSYATFDGEKWSISRYNAETGKVEKKQASASEISVWKILENGLTMGDIKKVFDGQDTAQKIQSKKFGLN